MTFFETLDLVRPEVWVSAQVVECGVNAKDSMSPICN